MIVVWHVCERGFAGGGVVSNVERSERMQFLQSPKAPAFKVFGVTLDRAACSAFSWRHKNERDLEFEAGGDAWMGKEGRHGSRLMSSEASVHSQAKTVVEEVKDSESSILCQISHARPHAQEARTQHIASYLSAAINAQKRELSLIHLSHAKCSTKSSYIPFACIMVCLC